MHGVEFDLHFADYPKAVAACGGVPVELTRDADVDAVVARLDGLVLTGGADVDPAAYGEAPDPDLGAVEPDRDDWELALLAAAEQRGIPVLCVCRGVQLLNVAKGGTLRQHVADNEGDGHPRFDEDGHSPAHGVDLVDGSLAASLLGTHIEVNSLHHQVIERVGEGLAVTGRSPDGTAEVLELGRDVLGVQWHPELLARPDATFAWLVEAARTRMSVRV
jgi:putative glutamine amidotransferase